MSFINFSPVWFFGYDVAMEAAFAIITLIISLYAFKIYKLSSQIQARFLGISFFLFSLSYIVQSVFNYFAISEMNETICRTVKIESILFFNTLGIYTHIILMTFGLVVLLYMTFKKERQRIFWLILLVSLLCIFFAENTLFTFFLLSTVYLCFITWHFLDNYLRNRQLKTALIVAAFLFLLFGNFHFLISINHHLFYVIGHILELLAYILILLNLYLVIKK